MVGENVPLELQLHLVSAEPLETQTITVLASQLSEKLTTPVRLRGEVELQGMPYILKIQTFDTRKGLELQDHRALTKMIEMARARSGLWLQGTYAYDPNIPGSRREPPLLRVIRRVLVGSRLKQTEWSFQAAPQDSESDQSSAESDLKVESAGGGQASRNNEGRPAILCRFALIQHF